MLMIPTTGSKILAKTAVDGTAMKLVGRLYETNGLDIIRSAHKVKTYCHEYLKRSNDRADWQRPAVADKSTVSHCQFSWIDRATVESMKAATQKPFAP